MTLDFDGREYGCVRPTLYGSSDQRGLDGGLCVGLDAVSAVSRTCCVTWPDQRLPACAFTPQCGGYGTIYVDESMKERRPRGYWCHEIEISWSDERRELLSGRHVFLHAGYLMFFSGGYPDGRSISAMRRSGESRFPWRRRRCHSIVLDGS